jgi:hypothetical protein
MMKENPLKKEFGAPDQQAWDISRFRSQSIWDPVTTATSVKNKDFVSQLEPMITLLPDPK